MSFDDAGAVRPRLLLKQIIVIEIAGGWDRLASWPWGDAGAIKSLGPTL
jgi:hypothetical protein